ncbi:hypothetical protein [Granulicella arctica]|uniref:Lipoprotein n=1 Tax=Granulicella arctica TaxID=940613 RepID=A0A7Y9PJ90_9BACT|nr:hypothetical protein [Granulicella arctica]NYF80930.1 hypothetical protein [Granulicella arctica]
MRARLALLALVPTLAGCRHADQDKKDTSTFHHRVECAQIATSGQWDDLLEGPYLDRTYYSPSLDTCVFVMKQSHRGEKDGSIHTAVSLVDALSRKPLWLNDPEAGETDEQINAKLNDELQKLQITP